MSGARRSARGSSAAIGLVLALVAQDAGAADLGAHGNLPGGSGGCAPCHLSAAPRRFDIGGFRLGEVPSGGKSRLADPIARFCWLCHRAGNPYGARPLDGRALAAPGHGVIPGKAMVPDAWAVGREIADPFWESGVGKAGMGYITCTTCHDIHDGGAPLFLRKSTAAGEDTGLCAACHPGRENFGLTGRRNIVVRDRLPYSTHPAARAGITARAGNKTPRCRDCHDVHRAQAPGARPVPGLLRGAPGETASDLCRGCHAFPAPGDRENHPMEAPAAGALPSGAFLTSDVLPDEWRARQHFDSGASGVRVLKGEAPRCGSCHDMHGGLPMTSLLYGPDAGSRRGGDWCFSCHAREPLLEFGHAGDTALAGSGDCARCHGSHREGAPPRWEAHRGFRAVHAAVPAAGRGSTVPPLDEGALRALVDTLRDGEPPARDQAFEVLSRLRPALDPAVFRSAVEDLRPIVRAQAARVIGALGDRRGGDILLPLAADADAGVRAAATAALAGSGDARAAAALVPLLADPALEVRRAAVAAFEALRDPLAIPGLVVLLDDPDWQLSTRARAILAGKDDARVLAAMLPEGRAPAAAAHLVDVLERISDPAAFEGVLSLLGHDNGLVRAAAAAALGRYSRPDSADGLIGALRTEQDLGVLSAAADSLVQTGDARAVPLLAGMLGNPGVYPAARRRVAQALAAAATPAVVPTLIDALANADVREEANAALERLTCRNFGADLARWRQWWEAQPPSFSLGRCR